MMAIKCRAWCVATRTMWDWDRIFDEVGMNVFFDSGTWVVEQFTNFNDCRGEDIYEGDVCRYETEDGTGVIAQVVFQAGEEGESCFMGFGMKVIRTFEHEIDIDCQPTDGWHGQLEVIGNIHENPELLANQTA